jgi:hypothetical protein
MSTMRPTSFRSYRQAVVESPLQIGNDAWPANQRIPRCSTVEGEVSSGWWRLRSKMACYRAAGAFVIHLI